MTRRLAILLVLLLSSSAAAAQTVAVRSGWQEAFTRLVLTVPEGIDWRLGRSGPDYLLTLDADDLTFDVAEVFDRIPATRLARLSPEGETLRIGLACDCHATAFLWQPDRLVIDLADGPPPVSSSFEVSLDTGGRVEPDPSAEAAPTALPAPWLNPPNLPLLVSTDPVRPDNLMPDPFHVRRQEAERLTAAEEALVLSIARAASQGLLTPTIDTPAVEERAPEPPAAEHVAQAPPGDPSRPPGMSARTAIDRDLGEADPFSATDDRADVVCLPQSYFAFETWGDQRPFHAQISSARRALVGEFDRLPPGAAADLARSYLFFGFGSEALAALALTETPSEDLAVLAELARLIDELPGTTGLFDDQIGCRTPAALWALLERPSIPARPELDRNGVLQHYKTLPAPVQGQVAGRLAPLFLEAEDEDAAAILLNRADRSPASDTEDVKLAEADLAMHYGDAESSLRDMIAAVRTDGRIGPDMLLRIFELSIETDRPVPPDLLDLSGVLRFEHRGQPVVADLVTAETRAHLLARDHDRALSALEDERARLPAERLKALLSETVMAMTATLDDLAFLEQVLPDPPRPLSAEAENAVARRLIGLGMAGPAAAVLQSVPVREAARDRRYLRAEIALTLGDFDRVDDLLNAMTDPRANDLRAAAHSARGAYDQAFTASRDTQPDPEAAWRAGAWSRLAESADPELSRVSALVIDRAPLEPDPSPGAPPGTADAARPAPTIAGGRALLAQSEEARAVLGAIIDRFPAPADAP